MSEFNHGTLPYELIIRTNTLVNNLGIFNLKTVIDAIKPRLITLLDIPEYLNTCVRKCIITILVQVYYYNILPMSITIK